MSDTSPSSDSGDVDAPGPRAARTEDFLHFNMREPLLGLKNFSGQNRIPARAWLRRYEAIAKALNWTETQKFSKFRLYLTGTAADWYYLKVDLADDPVLTYEDLKRLFLGDFEDTEEAYESMLSRKQGETEDVKSYILSKIQMCRSYNEDMPEAEVIRYVKEGLKGYIRTALACTKPNNYDELIVYCRNIENEHNRTENNKSKTSGPERLIEKLVERLETL